MFRLSRMQKSVGELNVTINRFYYWRKRDPKLWYKETSFKNITELTNLSSCLKWCLEDVGIITVEDLNLKWHKLANCIEFREKQWIELCTKIILNFSKGLKLKINKASLKEYEMVRKKIKMARSYSILK